MTEYLANIGELEQFYANIEEKFVSLAQLIDYVRHYAASIVTANEEKNQLPVELIRPIVRLTSKTIVHLMIKARMTFHPQCDVILDHTIQSGISENPIVDNKMMHLLLFTGKLYQFNGGRLGSFTHNAMSEILCG